MSATASATLAATSATLAITSAQESEDNANKIECVNFINNFNPKWDISSKQHYAECVQFVYPRDKNISPGGFAFGLMALIVVCIFLWKL